MAFSAGFLEDIRKSLVETIAMVERENATLSAKIDSLKEPSESDLKTSEDQKFLEELRLNESINGLSFRNVKKKVLDETYFETTADVICGQEDCALIVKAEIPSRKVVEFTLEFSEASSLGEIKQDLSSLIEECHLTFSLNALASFTRMNALRSEILYDLVNAYEDFFNVDVQYRELPGDTAAPESILVSAANPERQHKYFKITWNLKWNFRKLSIEHVFTVVHHHDLSKLPKLLPMLRKLEASGFVESKCCELVDLWREIGDLVANQ